MSEGRKYPINLWAALAQIPAFFLNIFALVFGVPMYKTNHYNLKEKIFDQIIKQRTASTDKKNFSDIILLVENF